MTERIQIKEKDIIETGGDGMYTYDTDLTILVRNKNKLEQLKKQILKDHEIINELKEQVEEHKRSGHVGNDYECTLCEEYLAYTKILGDEK